MKAYEVTPDLVGMSHKRKALRFVSLAGGFVVINMVLRRLWSFLSSGPLLEDFIVAAITGILFAMARVVGSTPTRFRQSRLDSGESSA